MSGWKLVFTRQAEKDARNLKQAGLKAKTDRLLNLLAADPFTREPAYEKLIGNFAGSYSRRINLQHRLVYQVYEDQRVVKIIRMWTHYE